MARMPRRFDRTRPSWQHVCNRVLGSPDWFPLIDPSGGPGPGRLLVRLFLFYSQVYFCRLASLEVSGNHYHGVLHFESERRVSRRELRRRAQRLWGKQKALEKVRGWGCRRWKRFSQSLFEMPDMMRDLARDFSRCFNDDWGRRGPLWVGRYKNTELLDRTALQECLLYDELQSVRAGLAAAPGQWEMSSAHWRLSDRPEAKQLVPLSELFPEAAGSGLTPEQWYLGKLLWRGTTASPENDAPIPEAVERRERQCGPERGVYLARRRFYVEGRALGTAELVRERILEQRACGFYTRRLHPVPQLNGLLFSLREQRSNARFLDWTAPQSGSKADLPPSRDGLPDKVGGESPVRPPPEPTSAEGAVPAATPSVSGGGQNP